MQQSRDQPNCRDRVIDRKNHSLDGEKGISKLLKTQLIQKGELRSQVGLGLGFCDRSLENEKNVTRAGSDLPVSVLSRPGGEQNLTWFCSGSPVWPQQPWGHGVLVAALRAPG